MSVVMLFEGHVKPGRLEAFVQYALEAQKALAGVDGCLASEQMIGIGDPRRILFKSIWRDEEAARSWQEGRGVDLERRAAALSLFERCSMSLMSTVTTWYNNVSGETPMTLIGAQPAQAAA